MFRQFKYAFQILLFLVLALASYLFISHFILQSVQVVGESMYPTLHDADRYFLNRWVCYLHSPKRNDIVVIKDPSDGVYVVKRIIAMPGESIFFKRGQIYVNGKPAKEPYLQVGTPTFTNAKENEELVLCGKDQYFVLGDNRKNSYDSRMYGSVRTPEHPRGVDALVPGIALEFHPARAVPPPAGLPPDQVLRLGLPISPLAVAFAKQSAGVNMPRPWVCIGVR